MPNPEPTSKDRSKQVSKLSARRGRPNLSLVTAHLLQPICPIWPMPAGPPHPRYPRTLLQYFLLTEAELDSLAAYYHQRPLTPRSVGVVVASDLASSSDLTKPASHESVGGPGWHSNVTATEILVSRLHSREIFPSLWTWSYPKAIDWCDEFLDNVGRRYGAYTRVKLKRRKIGQFIGLRDCSMPAWEVAEWEHWNSGARE